MSKRKCNWCGKEYEAGGLLKKGWAIFFNEEDVWYCSKKCQKEAEKASKRK